MKLLFWFQVFRLVSIWFGLSSRQNVVKAMVDTVNEVSKYLCEDKSVCLLSVSDEKCNFKPANA